MQPPNNAPAKSVDSDGKRMLIDNETRRLLVHLDSQEAAMLAIRSLLSDLASESLTTADRRRLKTRLEAAMQLTQKLTAERSTILSQISSHLPYQREPLRLSQLLHWVSVDLRNTVSAARQRLAHLATQLSRLSATVRLIQGEERRINAVAYQLATGMVGSDRYDASGHKSVQPAAVHFNVRS